jgi:hypothetical protein
VCCRAKSLLHLDTRDAAGCVVGDTRAVSSEFADSRVPAQSIRDLWGKLALGQVSLRVFGFPCQYHSTAGPYLVMSHLEGRQGFCQRSNFRQSYLIATTVKCVSKSVLIKLIVPRGAVIPTKKSSSLLSQFFLTFT